MQIIKANISIHPFENRNGQNFNMADAKFSVIDHEECLNALFLLHFEYLQYTWE